MGLICLLAFFSANVYGFESEGFLFDVISEEDLTVELSFVNYSDNLERVDIPATISHEGKTYNVTVIDSTAPKLSIFHIGYLYPRNRNAYTVRIINWK